MNVLEEIKQEGSIKVTGPGAKKPKPKQPKIDNTVVIHGTKIKLTKEQLYKDPRSKAEIKRSGWARSRQVSEYLSFINLELTEEQQRLVDNNLRMKEERRKGIKYSRTEKTWDESMKLAPQALLVLDGLKQGEWITTGQWIKNLEGSLKTMQQPERVVNYYKKSLENLGLIARQI